MYMNTINLPNDLLLKVIEYLDCGSLENVLLTSKYLLHILKLAGYQSEKQLREICLYNFCNKLNNKHLRSILYSFNKLHESIDNTYMQYLSLIGEGLGIQNSVFHLKNDNTLNNILIQYKSSKASARLEILAKNPRMVQYLQTNAKNVLDQLVTTSQNYLTDINLIMRFIGIVIVCLTSLLFKYHRGNSEDAAYIATILVTHLLYSKLFMRKIKFYTDKPNNPRMVFSKHMPEFTHASLEELHNQIAKAHTKLNNFSV